MKRIVSCLFVLLLICGCTNEIVQEEIIPEQEETQEIKQVEVKEGNYYDSVSQRATLTVSKTNEGYYFVVSWSQSANETKTWSMECKLQENRLVYAGENISLYTIDDEGNEIVADGASNCVGYFEVDGSNLLWSGACEDNLKACVFELAD